MPPTPLSPCASAPTSQLPAAGRCAVLALLGKLGLGGAHGVSHISSAPPVSAESLTHSTWAGCCLSTEDLSSLKNLI